MLLGASEPHRHDLSPVASAVCAPGPQPVGPACLPHAGRAHRFWSRHQGEPVGAFLTADPVGCVSETGLVLAPLLGSVRCVSVDDSLQGKAVRLRNLRCRLVLGAFAEYVLHDYRGGGRVVVGWVAPVGLWGVGGSGSSSMGGTVDGSR